jgi:hypothetical protein
MDFDQLMREGMAVHAWGNHGEVEGRYEELLLLLIVLLQVHHGHCAGDVCQDGRCTIKRQRENAGKTFLFVFISEKIKCPLAK